MQLCFYNGLYSTLITLIYIAVYTMPRLDQLIHIDPLVSERSVWGMYLFVTIVGATHSWNYYQLLESTGSVSWGGGMTVEWHKDKEDEMYKLTYIT